MGKWVPGLNTLRTGWKRASKVHVTLCQFPLTKGDIDLRIRNLYFGNMAISILFVFLILIPFLFFLTFGKVHLKNVN